MKTPKLRFKVSLQEEIPVSVCPTLYRLYKASTKYFAVINDSSRKQLQRKIFNAAMI
jgi:hypothetical protein